MMIGKSEILIQLILTLLICIGCSLSPTSDTGAWAMNSQVADGEEINEPAPIEMGAEQLKSYLPMLADKKVGMMVNQSSRIAETHLVDSLLSLGVHVEKVYAPEHGFRGKADAGEKVTDGKDGKTGLPIISLYGKNRKPTAEQLAGIDIMLFDLQDVGVRFYTYTSSLHYLMEACAEQNIPLVILDRPNPNGKFTGGNIHSLEETSFVGMHPVPIMHGLTIGEYGKMINGSAWLKDGIQCELSVIPCANYTRDMAYELPIRPSPNLPNLRSVLLYPTLCLLEGTVLSIGRGTEFPFQVYGHPDLPASDFNFTPTPSFGSKHPKLEGELCQGVDFREMPMDELQDLGLTLKYLVKAYQDFPDKENFFLKNGFFETLCGNGDLRKMIEAGKTAEEIEVSWRFDLRAFNLSKVPYLIYN